MVKPTWASSFKSHIWVFNVGRGLSIFIRTALNQGIIYDFGSSDDFKPTEFLRKNIIPYLDSYKESKIAQVIISHPHVDHISAIPSEINEKNNLLYSSLITCPHDKEEGAAKPEKIDWNRIKQPQGNEKLLEIYQSLFTGRNLPLQTICYDSPRSVPNLEYGLYYVRPPIVNKIFPSDDHEYVNGLSLVLFYRYGYHTLLIPGDINPEALKHIIDEGEGVEKRYTKFDRRQSSLNPDWHEVSGSQPSLKSVLKKHGISVLIAPHHGLESGFSEDLYRSIKDEKPGIIVFSEKRHLSDKDGKVKQFYHTAIGAKGQEVYVQNKKEKRFSVSTRNGHHILIQFQGTGGLPEIILEKDPYGLLEKLR
jgi:hypothetical protein